MWLNLYLITTLVSGIINVSKSMYIKKKMEYNNDEVIRKFNKLSTKSYLSYLVDVEIEYHDKFEKEQR